jgi:GSH-dependent disulfide-bond oxidoreductase
MFAGLVLLIMASAATTTKLGRRIDFQEAWKSSDHSPICLLIYATQNGWKIPILCEEMGIPYDWALIDFETNQQKSPEFLKINPNGRIPALIDREEGIAMRESSVIMEYLATKYNSPLFPVKDPKAKVLVQQWVAWQISGLGPMMGQAMAFQRLVLAVKGQYNELAIGRFRAESERLLQTLDTQLSDSGGPFILGPNITLADVACFPYVASAFWANVDIEEMPKLKAWIDMLHQRDSFRVGLTVPFPRPAFFGLEHATQEQIDAEIARNAGQFNVAVKKS